jgi:hypothetical protein
MTLIVQNQSAMSVPDLMLRRTARNNSSLVCDQHRCIVKADVIQVRSKQIGADGASDYKNRNHENGAQNVQTFCSKECPSEGMGGNGRCHKKASIACASVGALLILLTVQINCIRFGH